MGVPRLLSTTKPSTVELNMVCIILNILHLVHIFNSNWYSIGIFNSKDYCYVGQVLHKVWVTIKKCSFCFDLQKNKNHVSCSLLILKDNLCLKITLLIYNLYFLKVCKILFVFFVCFVLSFSREFSAHMERSKKYVINISFICLFSIYRHSTKF